LIGAFHHAGLVLSAAYRVQAGSLTLSHVTSDTACSQDYHTHSTVVVVPNGLSFGFPRGDFCCGILDATPVRDSYLHD
jgi:hypothetical protein